MNKVNIIWSHPRQNSLTYDVVNAISKMAAKQGKEVAITDLYRTGFSPVMTPVDEPDWSQPKIYSDEVNALASQLSDDDDLIFVFPVWWYSLPTMLKGYIERVWNNGIFYGENSRQPARKILWIALVGQTEQAFTKRYFDYVMSQTLNNGVSSFCGVKNSHVKFLYNTIGEDVADQECHYADLISQAVDTASQFLNDEQASSESM